MQKLKLFLSATLLALASIPSIANAIAITATSTYTYSATCLDCDGPTQGIPNGNPVQVTGSLTLIDYVYGTDIQLENFVSFSYNGPSIHVQPFTVSSDVATILGVGGNVADDVFYISWFDGFSELPKEFRAEPGNWRLSVDDFIPVQDFGNSFMFDNDSVDVSAPGTLTLMGLSLAVLAYRRKNKR